MGLIAAFKGLSNDKNEVGSVAGKTVHDIK
jgi:hypothetical protein